MDASIKLQPGQRELLENIGWYRRAVGKLTYLMVTGPNITFVVNVVSQFLSAPRTTHLQVVMKIFRYLKKALGRELLYSNYRHTPIAGFSDGD